MARLKIYDLADTGLDLVSASFNVDENDATLTLADGDMHDFLNNGETLLFVKNLGTAATITFPQMSATAIDLAAITDYVFGPFPTRTFNASSRPKNEADFSQQGTHNVVNFTLGTPTSVDLAVLRI